MQQQQVKVVIEVDIKKSTSPSKVAKRLAQQQDPAAPSPAAPSAHMARRMASLDPVLRTTCVPARVRCGCRAPLATLGRRDFGGALRHRYHHAYTQRGFEGGRKGVHYHEFFRYLDQLFGFEVSEAECRRVVVR